MRYLITVFLLFTSNLAGHTKVCHSCNSTFKFLSESKLKQSTPRQNYKDEQSFEDKKFGLITIKIVDNGSSIKSYSIQTTHYDLYLEGEYLDPLDTAKLLEAAWTVKKEFFQASPPENERMKIEFYAKRQNYLNALQRDELGQIDSGGYYWEGNKKAYLWWQTAGVDFSRYLLLHEAAHQFEHLCGKKARAANFWVEGVADFLGMHRWDGKNIKLGATMNSHLLRDKAANALKTYENLNNEFAEILLRPAYNYDESWAITHFLLNRNKELGRRLFKNMIGSDSLKKSWIETFKTDTLDEKFHSDLISWLNKMTSCPKDVFFVSWGDTWFGWEKATELKKLLRKKAPTVLDDLISHMEKLAEKNTRPEKLKQVYKAESVTVMLEILKTIPYYRHKSALEALSISQQDIPSLINSCYEEAIKKQRGNKKAEALVIFNALKKLEYKKATAMVDKYEKFLATQKQKALIHLKERQFYEAYLIYEQLCSIFPKSKDLPIHKLKEKLLSSKNSSLDIEQGKSYANLQQKMKSGSARKQVIHLCREFIKKFPNSRFKIQAEELLKKLN